MPDKQCLHECYLFYLKMIFYQKGNVHFTVKITLYDIYIHLYLTIKVLRVFCIIQYFFC